MSFGHKKLDVYRLSLNYVQWVYDHVENMTGVNRHARDQLLRASQSVPLNIAEGNGKYTDPDRMRFFAIARGSALECAAIQDVLVIGKAISKEEYQKGDDLLYRVVCMLTQMTKKSWRMQEDEAVYAVNEFQVDNDNENDHDNA